MEQEVAAVAPKGAVREQASYISADRLKLTLGVSEQLMRELKGVQDILSRKRKKAVTMEEALLEALTEFRERHDPVRKAERASQRKPVARQAARPLSRASNERQAARLSVPRRAQLRAEARHELNLRDRGQCVVRDATGSRCQETKWLEFHHLKPVAEGGTDDVSNLITVCAGHHKGIHGQSKQDKAVATDVTLIV